MAGDSLIERPNTQQGRIQSFAYVSAATACLFICVYFVTGHVSGSLQSDKIELEQKINPNEAPVGSLVRLPGIGIARASAVVAYREDFSETSGGGPAFKNVDDLQKIKGIGPKTAASISRWLTFEQHGQEQTHGLDSSISQ
jgi:competence ComEA-like helix-hairpin-helix protein